MKTKRAFTLVEVIIYAAILVVILGVLSNAILAISASYRSIATVRDIENGAMLSMNRMVREIKSASSIDGSQTLYNNANGSLYLRLDGSNMSKFYVSGGSIILEENGAVTGPLTSSNVTVSSLIFRQIVSTSSEAIKIEMTIQGEGVNSSISKKFYNTVVLRGSY